MNKIENIEYELDTTFTTSENYHLVMNTNLPPEKRKYISDQVKGDVYILVIDNNDRGKYIAGVALEHRPNNMIQINGLWSIKPGVGKWLLDKIAIEYRIPKYFRLFCRSLGLKQYYENLGFDTIWELPEDNYYELVRKTEKLF